MRVRPSTKKLPINNQVGKKKKKSDQIGLQNSFYQDKKNANNKNTFVWWTEFWKIPLPLWILIFGWKCLKRAILVEVSLDAKIGNISESCPLCDKEDETIEHSLFFYNVVRASWFCSPLGIQLHYIENNDLVKWWMKNFHIPMSSGGNDDEAKAFALALWRAIWMARNNLIFRPF